MTDPASRAHWPLHPDHITPGRPDIDAANILRVLNRSGWTARPARRTERNRSRVLPGSRVIRFKRSAWRSIMRMQQRNGKWTKRDAIRVVEIGGHELTHALQVNAMGKAAFVAQYATREGRLGLEGQGFAWQAYVLAVYGIGTGNWATRFMKRSWWWAKYAALPNKRQRRRVADAIEQARRDGQKRRKEVT